MEEHKLNPDVIECDYGDCETVVLPLVRQRAFHVTCWRHVQPILRDGFISENSSGRFATAFGSSANAFRRLRGEVSVFDYRRVTDEDVAASLHRCSPWQARVRCGHELGLFMLSEQACQRLEPWLPSGQRDVKQMLVPYVEAGYPGNLPIVQIERPFKSVVRLRIDPLVEVLEAGRLVQVLHGSHLLVTQLLVAKRR